MTAIEAKARAGIHQGWIIVIASYFLGLLTSGLLSYTRGLFLVPMALELESSRLELSIGFTISGIVAANTAPAAGAPLDRFPVRRLMALMALWTALGYFAIALIEALNWRWTFVPYGVMTLVVVVPLILLTMRPAPARQPIATPAEVDVHGPPIPPVARIWQRRDYLVNANFWAIVAIFGVMGCVFSGVCLHLFAHMTDIGIDPIRAAFVLSLMAGMALASKPMFGALVDRLDARVSVLVSLTMQAAGMVPLAEETYAGRLDLRHLRQLQRRIHDVHHALSAGVGVDGFPAPGPARPLAVEILASDRSLAPRCVAGATQSGRPLRSGGVRPAARAGFVAQQGRIRSASRRTTA
jgi:hypothetical protein